MELRRTALEGHAGHAARRVAQVSGIIAGFHLEFVNRFLGGSHEQYAAAATIIGLAAVDKPVVGVLPHAVKEHSVALELRSGLIEVRQLRCGAGHQDRELDYVVSTVGGKV